VVWKIKMYVKCCISKWFFVSRLIIDMFKSNW
jgi:hypothetical protein